MKKLISVLLSVVLITGLNPGSFAYADNESFSSGEKNGSVILGNDTESVLKNENTELDSDVQNLEAVQTQNRDGLQVASKQSLEAVNNGIETDFAETEMAALSAEEDVIVTGGNCPDPTALPGVASRRTAVGSGTVNQGNLVLLVRFQGDSAGDYDKAAQKYTGYNANPAYSSVNSTIRTEWENLMSRYNCVQDGYLGLSVRDYLFTVSEGKHDLISSFPQTTSDGKVEYITLPGSLADYSANGKSLDYKLITDTVDAYNQKYSGKLNGSYVDTDSDGMLDNLTVLCQVDSATFTSHSTTDSKGVSVSTTKGDLQVANFNLIDTVSFERESPEVAIHEYTHTLGIRDLYVKEGEKATLKPVGVWDLMSSLYGTPWMLADTREKLGWTTVEEVSEAGTYTLYAPGSGKTQAIKVKSPRSNTEYFVIEYRQQAANKYSNSALDKRIGGDGIIVYRVNPLYNSEGNGNVLFDSSSQAGYNIYVFRPGDNETKFLGGSGFANDTVSYATNAQISCAGDRSSIGSSDLAASLADGALVYSDGRNSGIVINAIEDGDGSEKFSIEFADYSTVDGWDSVGVAPDSFSSSSLGTAMTSDGTNLYVSVLNGRHSSVWKWNGSDWSQLKGNIAWNGTDSAPLLWSDGSLYALATSDGTVYSLMKYDSSNGWVSSGVSDISDSIGSNVALIEFNGKVSVGYVRDTWKTEIRSLQNNNWTTVQQYGTFYQIVDSCSDGADGAYLILSQSPGNIQILHYDSTGALISEDAATSLPSSCLNASVAYKDGVLYVAVIDGKKIKVFSSKADEMNFSQVGEDAFSGSSQIFNGLSLEVLANGSVVCAFAGEASGKVIVCSHKGVTEDLGQDDDVVAPEPIEVSYRTHVQNDGWQSNVTNGAVSGTSGKGYRLEGIEVSVSGSSYKGSVEYRTHVQNIGWQDYVADGKMAGTSGKSYRLEAIQLRLTGDLADHYDIYYRVHAQNFGWMGWAKNDEMAGTEGYAYRLEAIQIVLIEKGKPAPDKTFNDVVQNAEDCFASTKGYGAVDYTTHVQNIGWQNYVSDGSMAGTSGQSLRLEGIKIKLGSKAPMKGGISYSTHVQNIGWQEYVANDQMSGTSGRSLRLEAIRIKLTGDISESYDVYYRVHAQNVGWMGWAKNGEDAGTAGYSYRLEGIQIVLVEKGQPAPPTTLKGITATVSKAYQSK